MSQFLDNTNLQLIWEVVLDQNVIPEKYVNDVQSYFLQQVKPFYENERKNHDSLMSLNKHFITSFLSSIKKPKQEPVTFEDIQQNRISKFEKDYSQRQNEFTSAMTVPIPQQPNFSDALDVPLHETEDIVKRMIAQRNLEMEQMAIQSKNTDRSKVVQWLKPEETSIQVEKNPRGPQEYIKIDIKEIESPRVLESAIINLDPPLEKHISWGNNQIQEYTIESNEDLFSKIKKISNKNSFVDEGPIDLTERIINIEKQIDKLSKTLESYMERNNTMLTLIYNLLQTPVIIEKKEQEVQV
jgi:hypothetical protein